MRGLIRLHNAAQTEQARRDWAILANQATAAGMAEHVLRLKPPPTAGWRVIDQRIAQLRVVLHETSNAEKRFV